MAKKPKGLEKNCPHCRGCLQNGDALTIATDLSLKSISDHEFSDNSRESSGNKRSHRWTDELNCLCKNKNRSKRKVAQNCKLKQKANSSAKIGCQRVVNVKLVEQPAKEEQISRQEPKKLLKNVAKPENSTKQRFSILKKSYTLPPPQSNGRNHMIRSNQKRLFNNKMEILTENESGRHEVPPLMLDKITDKAKSPGNERQKTQKNNKCEVARLPLKQSSPRCLLPVCPNHDGRNGGETLEAVLYCSVCVQTVCYKCAFEKHKDHSVSPIQAAADNIRVNLTERKRRIENTISQMRAKRKSVEAQNQELQQHIHAQFEQVVQRLRKKEDQVMQEVEKLKKKKAGLIHGVQNQQETAWGQIDAVLKTQDDVKMIEEYNGLTLIDFKLPLSNCAILPAGKNGDSMHLKTETPRCTVDLNRVQDEIEKVCLLGPDGKTSIDGNDLIVSNEITPRQIKKRFGFKLDPTTAHSALKVSATNISVEYVGAERNGVIMRHNNPSMASLASNNPYNSKLTGLSVPNGVSSRLKRTQFVSVLGDTAISQGKQYWEVSVNRSMEYRLGVAYKHMQGAKSLADEHNCWALCLTYPDRFSAIHKHHKEYIFVATHTAAQATKVVRIGLFLDYERGVLSFYNASTAAEKRHLYTFRTFFNRPVWPLLSLRQGKLQILTGLPVPRNLVWKTR